MANQRHKSRTILLVVPSKKFSWCEYNAVQQALKKAKYQIQILSNGQLEATADNGNVIPIDVILSRIDVSHYDGVFLIGGPATIEYLNIPQIHSIIKDARDMGIAYGAIDLAVRILAYAGGLVGKAATGLNEDGKLNQIFETHGVRYRSSTELRSENRNVVIDGIIVTAQGPDDADAYAQGILEVLHKERADIVDDPTCKRVI